MTEQNASHGAQPSYDSKFEQRIAPTMLSLGFVRCDDYYNDASGLPLVFTDKQDAPYRAKPDWHHPRLDLYVETKCHALNNKTSQSTANRALDRQRNYRGGRLILKDLLNLQWSHSRYKQAGVQFVLTPQNLVVVFDEPIPFDEMLTYKKAGLVAINIDSLRSYLGYIHFARKGLALQFDMPYREQGVSFVL
ncbi:hypothetical protein [Cupriavidus sp. D39]|uniref:hypothetical protein n=1 Tax=Cupriavidus sp. D39 TaxID=2997877 RepID=UPI00226E76E3|nr:hypothetical protein [Cupriavidus sp. D39]MCY0855746.1 hypothetical protein [Cupriavidus sp. D39]